MYATRGGVCRVPTAVVPAERFMFGWRADEENATVLIPRDNRGRVIKTGERYGTRTTSTRRYIHVGLRKRRGARISFIGPTEGGFLKPKQPPSVRDAKRREGEK